MTKYNNTIKIFISLIIIAAINLRLDAAPTTIKGSLDSVSIIMGMQTKLHYQIVQDKGLKGRFLQGEDNNNKHFISPNIEIIGTPKQDTTKLGNNRIQIDRTYLIQSFDSGVWVIPAAKFIVEKDTFLSNELNLKVVPVNVDKLKNKIHGLKPIEVIEPHFLDNLPDFIYYYWWVILLALLLIIGIILIIIIKKKGKHFILKKKKEVPPYEEAVDALNALKLKKLWQNGKEKEYFTNLTDILKRYINRRFGINAIEMTTSQIIDTIKESAEIKEFNKEIKSILDIADYIKFTNEKSLPDENELAWKKAYDFIENTKPVAVTNEKDDTANGPTSDEKVQENNNKKAANNFSDDSASGNDLIITDNIIKNSSNNLNKDKDNLSQ